MDTKTTTPPEAEQHWPDRINQAYYGELGERFALVSRNRVNWLASQVRGETVLDVGCSQGILSILLAREGLRVTGIDISQATLDYARAELGKETTGVTERVELVHTELAMLDPGRLFDSVILGEVLEHQTLPERFLRRAVSHISPGGHLVLTTPFGFHPWPDHKCTLYPADIEAMAEGILEIKELDVLDGYIRFVGGKEAEPKPARRHFALAATQQAAEQLKEEIETVNTKLKRVDSKAASLKETLSKTTAELTSRATAAEKKAAALLEQMNIVREETEAVRKLKSAADEKVVTLERQAENLDGRLSLLGTKSETLAVKLTTEIKRLSANASDSAKEMAALVRSRDEFQEQAAALEKSRAEAAGQLDLSREEAGQLAQKLQAAESRTSELDAALLAAQSRLAGTEKGRDQLQGQLAALEKSRDETAGQLDISRTSENNLRESNVRLRLDLTSSRREVEALAKARSFLEKAMADAVSERNSEREDHQKEIADLESRLERQGEVMEAKSVALENRAQVVREMISFQLGAAILEALRSPAKALTLPATLWRIHLDAESRRAGKKLKDEISRRGPHFKKVADLLVNSGLPSLVEYLDSLKFSPERKAAALFSLAKELIVQSPKCALDAAREAEKLDTKPYRAKWLAFRLYEQGHITEPAALLAGPAKTSELSASEQKRAEEIAVFTKLRANFPLIPARRKPSYNAEDGSLLYVAASSLPYHTTGYTTRTHELLLALKETGAKTCVLTRPGYPWDRTDRQGEPSGMTTVFEGIEYTHRRSPSMSLPLDLYLEEAARTIAKVARERRVSAIHAASNHVNALPALIAARTLGIPFAYEMRGLWDLSKASKIPGYDQSERFQLGIDLEAHVAKNADRVYVISNALGRFIETWGVEKAKSHLLPNCVNPATIERAQKAAGPKLETFTVGYAGSLVPYEGLDLLVEAIAELKKDKVTINARIIGAGPSRSDLEMTAKKLGVSQQIEFMGKLSPDDSRTRLAETHAAVLPRRPDRVCEIIPPIKIVEALSLGLPVIVSDLPVLREEINGQCGCSIFPAGSASGLASALRDHCVKPLIQRAPTNNNIRFWSTCVSLLSQKHEISQITQPELPKNPRGIPLAIPPAASKQPKIEIPESTLERTIILGPKQHTLLRAQIGGRNTVVLFTNLVDGREENNKGAVADIRFLDGEGKTISSPYQGCKASDRFAAYIYLPVGASGNPHATFHRLLPPENAMQVEIRIFAWATKSGITALAGTSCDELTAEHVRRAISRNETPMPRWWYDDAARLTQASGELKLQQQLLSHALKFFTEDKKLFQRLLATESEIQELGEGWQPPLSVGKRVPRKTDLITVCHLHKTAYPFENSGGAIRGLNILKSQKAVGLDPYVITPAGYPGSAEHTDVAQQETVEGIEHFRIGPGTPGVSALLPREQTIYSAWQMARVLMKRGGSLVHAASGVRGYELALMAFSMRDVFSIPVVYEVRSFHEHTWKVLSDDVFGCERTKMRIQKENECMLKADFVVTISETMRAALIDRGVPRDRIDVIPNAIDATRFQHKHERADIPELQGAECIVGYVSNMSKREGHFYLLQAVAELRSRGRDIRCLLVGNGRERAFLESTAADLGISHVTVFPGEVDHRNVGAYYQAIDIFVVPRIPDFAADRVTPLKPYEAMAHGKPLIVSDLPALREIVGNNERGLLTKPGDVSSLVYSIENLLRNTDQTEARRQTAQKWVFAERTWEANAKKYCLIYESLLKRHVS